MQRGNRTGSGIVWIPAALVSKAEYRRLPAGALPASGNSASQTGETPASIEQPILPTARPAPKIIRVDFSPPDVDELPSGVFGEAVRLGRNIFNDTQTYARAYVGNGANCAICHGADGQGTQVSGRYVFPPLWGKDSFNAGAGMTQVHNAAAFIRANMPLGQGNTLTEQEARDVPKYMDSHTRAVDPRLVTS